MNFRNEISREELINKYDPDRLDPRFAVLPITDLIKIISERGADKIIKENQYLSFSSYNRDSVKKIEQNPNRYSQSNQFSQTHQFDQFDQFNRGIQNNQNMKKSFNQNIKKDEKIITSILQKPKDNQPIQIVKSKQSETRNSFNKKPFQNTNILPNKISNPIRNNFIQGNNKGSNELLKNQKPEFFSDDENIRIPDSVYKEQLIPQTNSINNYQHSGYPELQYPHSSNLEYENEQLEIAIKESLMSYDTETKKKKYDFSFDEINQEKILDKEIKEEIEIQIIEDVILNNWLHLDPPENFDIKILDNLYDDLVKYNFIMAREKISKIENLNHMEWVKSLSYNNQKLKILLSKKDENCHRCLKL